MSLGERFEETLRSARSGAGWALADLYRDVHPRVLRYLRALDGAEAEDLASEVWLDAIDGLDRFEGDERAFRAWMFTIARRRWIDLRRRRARRGTEPVSPERLTTHARIGNVEDEALAALATEEALSRIASLPSDQAEVLLLRALAGLEVRQVARIMGKRPGTVRVLQHRALRRLARTMAEQGVTR